MCHETDEFEREAKKVALAINVATTQQAISILMYNQLNDTKLEDPFLGTLVSFIYWLKNWFVIKDGVPIIIEAYPSSGPSDDNDYYLAFPHTNLDTILDTIQKSSIFEHSEYCKYKSLKNIIKNVCKKVDNYLSGATNDYPGDAVNIIKKIVDQMRHHHPL